MNFPMFFPAWLQVILGISQEEHRAIAVTGLLICLIVGFGFLVFPYIHGQTHPLQAIGLLFLVMIVPFWLFGAAMIVVLILAVLVWAVGHAIKILCNS